MYITTCETHISPRVKHMTSAGSGRETGRSGPVHWDGPEGWDGREGGGGSRMGDTCTPVADSCHCMAKATTVL